MTPDAISELLVPYLGGGRLSAVQLEQIAAYLDLLVRWNARINLTAVRKPEHIVSRHFGESLFAARNLSRPADAFTAADLGSGAGFPGLPLKIWAPSLRLTLIESRNKKATFLHEVIRALNLTDTEVFSGRGEDLDRRFDLVTIRAVERFDFALEIAARLVSIQGRLALLIGSAQADIARNHVGHLQWSDPLPVPLSSARVFLVGRNLAGQESSQ